MMNNNIFSNFYTKVLNFFQKEKESQGGNTKSTAQNRLKLVLMQDRSNLDGAAMQKMREQLIEVISKYIEIDEEALDLNLESEGEEIALMLNIPVLKARTREEIDALEFEEEESKKKEIEEAVAAALAEKEETSEEENEESEETDADAEETTEEAKITETEEVQEETPKEEISEEAEESEEAAEEIEKGETEQVSEADEKPSKKSKKK